MAQRRAQIAEAEASTIRAHDRFEASKAANQAAMAESRLGATERQLSATQSALQSQQQAMVDMAAKLKDARETIAKIATVKDDRGMVITLKGEVLFMTGKSDLKPAAMAKLDTIAEALKGKEAPIKIVGFTDNVGALSMNMDLSQKRATSVRDYLVSKGLPQDLVKAEGGGPRAPSPTTRRSRAARATGGSRSSSAEALMPTHLSVVAQTDIGLVRELNEDAFVVADLTGGSLMRETRLARFEVGTSGVLLAVSDGLGGHKAGDVASALVVQAMQRALAQHGPDEPPDALLETAAKQANREVWTAAHEPGRERMGATLTALFLRNRTAHIAEVGDSRAYLLRGGELRQVTHDQSYVQLLLDSGIVTREEADENPNRNVILQAMGLSPDVKVALGRLELRQRDCFVLCSDGLWNKMTSEEIRGTILGAPRLDVACARLVALAKDRGGEDNITAIVAGVSGDLPVVASRESISDTFFVVQEFELGQKPRSSQAHR